MNRIKELREQLGMKQSWLAAKLHVGQTAVSNYEAGIRDPSVDTICLLCDIFGCSADYLLGRDEDDRETVSEQEAALVRAYNAAPLTVQTAITVLLSPYNKETEKNTSVG